MTIVFNYFVCSSSSAFMIRGVIVSLAVA